MIQSSDQVNIVAKILCEVPVYNKIKNIKNIWASFSWKILNIVLHKILILIKNKTMTSRPQGKSPD